MYSLKDLRQFATIIFILLFAWGFSSCSNKSGSGLTGDNGEIEIVFLQLNDVYEIEALEGGESGGLDRVSTIRKKLLKDNPNVISVLSGDFLNPSVIGTMKVEGERINGKHMVEVLNAMHLDLVTFGNHEFDLKFPDLQKRLNESEFGWVSSNVKHKTDSLILPFYRYHDNKDIPVREYVILDAVDEDGTQIRIGIIGVTLPFNQSEYVHYDDVQKSAGKAIKELKDQVDVIIALTHLDIEDDKKFALQFPNIPLLMGGHDHNNMYEIVGNSRIAKADANAKTVYVHRLMYNKKSGKTGINSELVKVGSNIASDPEVAQVISKWTNIARSSFSDQGFNPDEVLSRISEPLEGREKVIRHQSTNLGRLIARAMIASSSKAKIALLNSGSIRVDDVLSDQITQYDVIRMMPFGGPVHEVQMKGSLLRKVLETGAGNKGKGGFLQMEGVEMNAENKEIMIEGKSLNDKVSYWVVLPDFMLTGYESNFGYLTRENKEILSILETDPSDARSNKRDIRHAVIDYLRYGGK